MTDNEGPSKLREILILIRHRLLAGFFTILPAAFTLWAIIVVIRVGDSILQPIIQQIFGKPLPGFGLVLTLILLYLIGGLIAHRVVDRLVAFGESLLQKIPLAGPIYGTVKQTIDVLKANFSQEQFSRVVFLEYPRAGIWALGFVTREINLDEQEAYCIFVPTTPNPTSGVLVVIEQSETRPCGMSVEEAIKFVISGGAVSRPGLVV